MAYGNDFRVATLQTGTDPSAFTPAGARREVQSPNNGRPLGSEFQPAAIAFKDSVYLAWKTRKDGKLALLSSDSYLFEKDGSSLNILDHLISGGPAMTNIDRRLLMIVYRGALGDLFNDEDQHLYMIKSSNGVDWSDPQIIARTASRNLSPVLSHLNGRVLLTYNSLTNDYSYLRYSDDDGKTWSDPKRLQYTANSSLTVPHVLGLDTRIRGGEMLWQNPPDLFYIISQSNGITSLPWNFDINESFTWRKYGKTIVPNSMVYYNFRYYLLYYGDPLHLSISTQGFELGDPSIEKIVVEVN